MSSRLRRPAFVLFVAAVQWEDRVLLVSSCDPESHASLETHTYFMNISV